MPFQRKKFPNIVLCLCGWLALGPSSFTPPLTLFASILLGSNLLRRGPMISQVGPYTQIAFSLLNQRFPTFRIWIEMSRFRPSRLSWFGNGRGLLEFGLSFGKLLMKGWLAFHKLWTCEAWYLIFRLLFSFSLHRPTWTIMQVLWDCDEASELWSQRIKEE